MKTTQRSLQTGIAIVLISSFAPHADAGFAWFRRSTDTIRVSGQTVLNTNATLEAVIMFPSTGYAGGKIFNEWTSSFEDKKLDVHTNRVRGFTYPQRPEFDGTNTIAPDVWHHIAFVHDTGEERIYVDGFLIASRIRDSAIGNGNGLGFVGAIFRDGGISPSFIGFIDSLRISRLARYNGASFTPLIGDFSSDGDTLLVYNFNEVPGSTTVADNSSLQRTGRLGFGFAGATSPTFVTNSSGISLRIERSYTFVAVSWPSVATNQFLEFATNLARPIVWTPVTNKSVIGRSEFTVTLEPHFGDGFFRLQRR